MADPSSREDGAWFQGAEPSSVNVELKPDGREPVNKVIMDLRGALPDQVLRAGWGASSPCQVP